MDENTNHYDLESISDGVKYLQDGYIEYCEEVISNRALPNIYDGLKPVNRRILATLHKDGVLPSKNYMKCARISGNVLALHPHGDASVYAAMVLMTDKNGSLAFPLVEGSGSFGGVYKTDPPAASRYTEARMSVGAYNEYFGEMNGINMIPNFDSTESEPELLPVSFPAVLVNSTTGIAVGFKSNVPSFNFNDVCKLVIEYIKDGSCHTVIEPDFVTGGYYVHNNKELQKLMQTGQGRIKLRGKYSVNGKEINVSEVPYGKTIQGLLKQINDKNISAIRNAYDTDDFEHGLMFTVDCTAKNRVDEAVYSMYKDTDFQYTYNADITVIKDGMPIRTGVWGIIEEWVKWRREILLKEYNYQKSVLEQNIRESEAFMNVVNDREKCLELVSIAAEKGRQHARDFVEKNFTREQVPKDLIGFVSKQSLQNYYDGGKYATQYESMKKQLEQYKSWIADIDSVIVNQMNELIAKYGEKLKRRTEITTKDYEFIDNTGSAAVKAEDDSTVYYALKNGFLRKCSFPFEDKDATCYFEGKANDVLIAFDNRGRILRTYCSDLGLMNPSDIGLYLPRYFNLEESDDYRIMWIGRMTGDTLMLLYKDGNIGFVDTSEWLNNTRNVKVLERGISKACANELGWVFTDIPKVLFVTDIEGRIGWTLTDEIKHKDRTAKTKVFNVKKGTYIDTFASYNDVMSLTILNDMSAYKDRLKKLKDVSDFKGNVNDFVATF